MMEIAMPLVVGVLAAIVLFDLRRRAADNNRNELQHVRSSSILLGAHSKGMQEFLAASDAPDSLKSVLIWFSDALSDRDAMTRIAQSLAAGRDLSTVPADPVASEQIEALERLPPGLRRAFATAVVTGMMASLLQWPETAAEFESLSARLLSDPQREVTTVVTVSRFRRLDLGAGQAAMPVMAAI